ncbi:MAG: alginate export family protein [Geobacteraceae bacterium]|nr:alginate export family protein [Geobacteraceae bacterium]
MNAIRVKRLSAILVALHLIGGATASWAEEKPATPPPALDWADRIKNPVEWFSWGADVRLRNDSSNNPYLIDADPPGHSYSFERLRIREWNTLRPRQELEFKLRFTWEGRHYWLPASKEEWDESEIVIDSLSATYRFPNIPVTLIVGRQDMVFGDGWLISDGTPLDGPRTNYFDALRATVDLKKIKSSLDLIYIDQTSRSNRWLTPFYNKSKALMEQDERGAIAYFSNKAIDGTPIDAYYIYKHDEAVLPSGDNGDVNTFGGSLAHDFTGNLSGRVEAAYQFGIRANAAMFPAQGSDFSAWGLTSRLTYSFRDPAKNQMWLGYEGLSGNDAHDSHNHQFDPLWGRWAKYSELFPNDLDRPGDRSNLHRINLGYQVAPASWLLQVNYQALFAYANRYSGAPGFSNHGSFKGNLFTAIVRYTFNRFWSGYILGEYFTPGNYYEAPPGGGPLDSRRDPASFLRAEIVYTF